MTLHEPLVSIHDVMPSTMGQVQALMDVAAASDVRQLTLLVVPGLEWSRNDLDVIRRWQDEGHALAGHGWVHQCQPPRGWYHRLHSRILSRNVAEHLSCETVAQRLALMDRCADWFHVTRLGLPLLYVPPAWALGVPRDRLQRTPFQLVETLAGVTHCQTGFLHRLPLLGFEADTTLRRWFVARFNRANLVAANRLRRPVRVSIHPHDLELKLAESLRDCLRQCRWATGYECLLDNRRRASHRHPAAAETFAGAPRA